jgi:putative multiple sugar transport system permease protein
MSRISDGVRTLTGGRGLSQYSMIIALVAILIVFQILTGGVTLNPSNVINVVQQYAYILILAIGMVMVIIAGHIDLSVGSIAAFVGVVVAQAMSEWHWVPGAAMLLGLVVGVVVGAWQGFWVAFVRVPAFIVTLAGQLIFRGANQLVGNATPHTTPDSYNWIGAGFIPDFGGGPFSNGTLILGAIAVIAMIYVEVRGRRRRHTMHAKLTPLWTSIVKMVVLGAVILFGTYLFASGNPGSSFPVAGIIAGALIIIYGFVTRRTIFGRQIYAVGGNSAAAQLSGVNSRSVNFFVMLNMGVLSAIAGMVYVGYSNASGPSDGQGWELDAIAAVFVGGAAVSGGIGTVGGSIVGAFVMAFLSNGLNILGIDSTIVAIVRGLVLLVAVAFDVYNKTQGRPSIIGWLLKNARRSAVTDEGLSVQPISIADDTTKVNK